MIGERYKYKEFQRKRVINDVEFETPKPPHSKEIDGYGLKPKDQRFVPVTIPSDLHMWEKAEREAFISSEWDKRRNGYWFYNNGYLEYVTGIHYFYLAYWTFPVVKDGVKKLGLPNFVDSDRDHFYHWQACQDDKNCFGQFEITNRRDGKTYRGLCTNYELISRSPESKSGMQSKNNRDGKDIFDKLVKSWQKLPYYFKPIDTGETHPASSLKFQEPSKRGTKNQKKEYTKVLRSEIDYGTAKDEEYDGEGLLFYMGDEVGKTAPSEADVYRRWFIVKECLADGATVTGKGLLTTTVEEITRKGLENCQKLWEESDPNSKSELGQTVSGLYRYFKPAYYGFRGADKSGDSFIDEYGYTDIERTKEYLETRRRGLNGTSLASEKHKYPFVPAEAFIVENDESPFDTDRVYSQIEYNTGLSESMVRRGNFVWVEKDVEVVFKDSSEGRWKVVWFPEEHERNNCQIIYGNYTPCNATRIVSGVDPYDHRVTTDGKKSDAASYVRLKYDPINPYNSKMFVAQYVARPPKPEMFYEDMVMQSFFYGCEILCETNKIGIVNYFRMRGYEKYLMKRPEPTHTPHSKKNQREYGIPMTGEDARNALVGAVETEIYDNVGYLEEEDKYATCYFDELLLDWAKFDVNNWTPYDCTVASGLALLAERKYIKEKKETFAPMEFFKAYKNKGTESTRA